MERVSFIIPVSRLHLEMEQTQANSEVERSSIDTALDFVEEQTTKHVLRALITKKIVTEENILRLKESLFTAQRQRKPNPKLIAIFCLYLLGSSRQEIADTLECSESLVRLSINEIYQIFALDLKDFSGTIERKRRLIALAIDEGLLP